MDLLQIEIHVHITSHNPIELSKKEVRVKRKNRKMLQFFNFRICKLDLLISFDDKKTKKIIENNLSIV